MATQLFLRNAASSLGGAGQKLLSTTRGTASVNKVTSTTASGTNIAVTEAGGGQVLTWFTEPLRAITISGSVTVNVRGREAATTVNAGAGILVERCNNAGAVLSTIVADTTIPAAITEYGTTDAAKTASYTPTSTAIGVGERIKVTLKVRNVGTMAANASGVTNTVDGPTAAAAGDTYVTFTENLQFVADLADDVESSGALPGGTPIQEDIATPSDAPPSFGGSGAHIAGISTTASFAVPAGVTSGDIIVIPVFVNSVGTIIGLPAGFANAEASPVVADLGGGFVSHSLYVFWKRATGADTGTYDFTLDSNEYRAGAAHRYTGCKAIGSPWETPSDSAIDLTNNTITPTVDVTTAGANRRLVFAGSDWAGGSWTPPTDFTERMDAGDGVHTLADKAQAVAGNSGSVTATCAGNDRRTAWLGALIGTSAGGATDLADDTESVTAQLSGSPTSSAISSVANVESVAAQPSGSPAISAVGKASDAESVAVLPGGTAVNSVINKATDVESIAAQPGGSPISSTASKVTDIESGAVLPNGSPAASTIGKANTSLISVPLLAGSPIGESFLVIQQDALISGGVLPSGTPIKSTADRASVGVAAPALPAGTAIRSQINKSEALRGWAVLPGGTAVDSRISSPASLLDQTLVPGAPLPAGAPVGTAMTAGLALVVDVGPPPIDVGVSVPWPIKADVWNAAEIAEISNPVLTIDRTP